MNGNAYLNLTDIDRAFVDEAIAGAQRRTAAEGSVFTPELEAMLRDLLSQPEMLKRLLDATGA